MTHYLFASRQDLAVGTAIKWKWRRTDMVRGRQAFIDPEGDVVLVTSDARDVVAAGQSAKVYLGEAWVFAFGDPRKAIRAHAGRILAGHWYKGQVSFGPPKHTI